VAGQTGGGRDILLVQLTIAAGGHVVAAGRGERKLELLRSLGAGAVDYSAPDWTQIVRRETGGAGPDVILDGSVDRSDRTFSPSSHRAAGSPHTGRRVVPLPRSTRPRPSGDR